jgi:small GTP-binding protein
MANKPNSQIRLKLLIIGDSAVGKTSMLLKYTDNFFPESHLATIGVEFKTKEVEYNGYKIELQVWDTAGQERFKSITKSFFRNANGIIFVYDITQKNTFKNVKDWIKDSEVNDFGFQRILVGNKIDLQNKRQVSLEDAKEWADKKNMEVIETSAKTGANIDKAVLKLIELILQNKTNDEIMNKFGVTEKKNTEKLNNKDNKTKKSKKCC